MKTVTVGQYDVETNQVVMTEVTYYIILNYTKLCVSVFCRHICRVLVHCVKPDLKSNEMNCTNPFWVTYYWEGNKNLLWRTGGISETL